MSKQSKITINQNDNCSAEVVAGNKTVKNNITIDNRYISLRVKVFIGSVIAVSIMLAVSINSSSGQSLLTLTSIKKQVANLAKTIEQSSTEEVKYKIRKSSVKYTKDGKISIHLIKDEFYPGGLSKVTRVYKDVIGKGSNGYVKGFKFIRGCSEYNKDGTETYAMSYDAINSKMLVEVGTARFTDTEAKGRDPILSQLATEIYKQIFKIPEASL